MSTKIYLFKAHPINVSNLAIYAMDSIFINKLFGPCRPYIENKFLFCEPGLVDIEISKFTDTTTRKVEWHQHIKIFEGLVDQATQVDQNLVFGNYSDEQIEIIAGHFKNCITIGINYNESLYPYLISNMAQYHVYALKQGYILPNKVDLEILSGSDPVDYYKTAFDQLNLIPKSSISKFDYNIDIQDFFKPNIMTDHFNNLGDLPITSDSLYHKWLTQQGDDIPV